MRGASFIAHVCEQQAKQKSQQLRSISAYSTLALNKCAMDVSDYTHTSIGVHVSSPTSFIAQLCQVPLHLSYRPSIAALAFGTVQGSINLQHSSLVPLTNSACPGMCTCNIFRAPNGINSYIQDLALFKTPSHQQAVWHTCSQHLNLALHKLFLTNVISIQDPSSIRQPSPKAIITRALVWACTIYLITINRALQ